MWRQKYWIFWLIFAIIKRLILKILLPLPPDPRPSPESPPAAEIPSSQPEVTSLLELQKKVLCLKEDLNQDQQEVCKLIDVELPVAEQQERSEVLKGSLINVIEKLMQAGVPVEGLIQKPHMLSQLAWGRGLQLEPHEQSALRVLDGLLEAPGTVPAYFRSPETWKEMIGSAGDIFKGPKDFFKQCYAENRGLTLGVSAAVILGMGVLGYKFFMASDEKQPEKEGMSTKAKVGLGLAAVSAIAYYLGGDKLKEYVKDSVKNQPIKAFGEGEGSRPVVLDKKVDLNQQALEKPDGSKIVCIGDSMMKGMSGRREWTKNPDFIGEVGMASGKTLDRLKESESRKKLEGKEEALIYTGGNNVEKDPPKKIVADMIEMAQISRKAGIKNITICTRFPIDPRRKELPDPPRPDPKNPNKMIKDTKRLGPEGFSERQRANMALREELIQAYQLNMFPPNTKLVDLFGYFANENGEMRQEFVKGDYLHPYDAYVPALNYMRA